MKSVYFVRHGESESNADGLIHGAAKTALTERGLIQADAIAERCTQLRIDRIVVSSALRTRQTAEPIIKKLQKPVEYSDLFLEWERGTHRIGKRWDDPKVMAKAEELMDRLGEPGWRQTDEENFDDLNMRAAKALSHLLSISDDNLLLVGHGLFSRILLGKALMGDDFTPRDCRHFINSLATANTGLSVLTHQNPRSHNPNGWTLVTWNDHAHLG